MASNLKAVCVLIKQNSSNTFDLVFKADVNLHVSSGLTVKVNSASAAKNLCF